MHTQTPDAKKTVPISDKPGLNEYQQALNHENGINCETSLKDAIDCYLISANKKYFPAYARLMHINFMTGGDYSKWYQKIAEFIQAGTNTFEGDEELGAYNFSFYLIYLINQDTEQAISYLKKSVETNYAPALNALGECYEYGLHGISRDPQNAKKYYQLAAEKGDKAAKLKLEFFTIFKGTVPFQHLKFGKEIYSGPFSQIIHAQYNGMPVVLKRPKMTEWSLEGIKREALILEGIKTSPHAHILELVGICSDTQYIVTKLVANGSIWDEIDNNRELKWGDVFRIVKGLALALDHLHNKLKRIHGDLKGGNILLDAKKEAVLVDFGCSSEWKGVPIKTLGDSLPWESPELLLTRMASIYSDMWAFAMVCIELANRREPLAECEKDKDKAKKILKLEQSERPYLTEACPKPFKEFIFKFFTAPEKRPTAAQAASEIQKIIDMNLPETDQVVPFPR